MPYRTKNIQSTHWTGPNPTYETLKEGKTETSGVKPGTHWKNPGTCPPPPPLRCPPWCTLSGLARAIDWSERAVGWSARAVDWSARTIVFFLPANHCPPPSSSSAWGVHCTSLLGCLKIWIKLSLLINLFYKIYLFPSFFGREHSRIIHAHHTQLTFQFHSQECKKVLLETIKLR